MSEFDHLVLPTATLAVARERLTALGFTVAPDGVHPFGTANCCVFFEDGTFIEPLAIADAEQADRSAADGNAFVARDALFRAISGDEGLSALVIKSIDAKADDVRFRSCGISGGPVLDFQRAMIDAVGKSDIAAFSLAFAAEKTSPGAYYFACQRVRSPAVDRRALQQHENGAQAIVGVEARVLNPAQHAAFFDALFEQAHRQSPANEWVWSSGDFSFRLRDGDNAGVELTEVRFRVADAASLATLLRQRSVAYEAVNATLTVMPAPGQGAIFSFEATQ